MVIVRLAYVNVCMNLREKKYGMGQCYKPTYKFRLIYSSKIESSIGTFPFRKITGICISKTVRRICSLISLTLER